MMRATVQKALLRVLPRTAPVAAVEDGLVARLRTTLAAPAVRAEAERWLEAADQARLTTDWEGSPKAVDFAALLVAARSLLRVRGSVEVGVFRGGTSAILAQTVPPGGFHVTIDPFGLPGQAYDQPAYRDWSSAVQTVSRLTAFARARNVHHLHYWMDSLAFAAADLLRVPGGVNVVHLDGDHSYHALRAELRYFIRRVAAPALFILDDHDEHFPGIELAVRLHGRRLLPVFHSTYSLPGYGVAGFSAWLLARAGAALQPGEHP